MVSKKTVNTLLASAVTLAVAGMSGQALALDADQEKCYGVVKAGHNDCGSADGAHSCGGQAEVDGSGAEWVAVPKGLCEKLAHGSLEPMTDEHHGEEHHEEH